MLHRAPCARRAPACGTSPFGGVDSVMSPGLALCEACSRGSSAGGFCRAELAWREAGWTMSRWARITQAGPGPGREADTNERTNEESRRARRRSSAAATMRDEVTSPNRLPRDGTRARPGPGGHRVLLTRRVPGWARGAAATSSSLTITAGRRLSASLPTTGSRSTTRISPRSTVSLVIPVQAVGDGALPVRRGTGIVPFPPRQRIRLPQILPVKTADRGPDPGRSRREPLALDVPVEDLQVCPAQTHAYPHTWKVVQRASGRISGRRYYEGCSGSGSECVPRV